MQNTTSLVATAPATTLVRRLRWRRRPPARIRSPLSATAAAMMLGVTAMAGALAAPPALLWEIEGFDNPESVRFDPARERLYVSNVNGNPTEADGNGYLSLLALDGTVLERRWVTDLDAPKGMALHDGRLFVSDISRLVAVDTASGTIVATYQAPEARFLNDVTVDDEGRVYVSDMLDDAIYRLADGHFQVWLREGALDGPNGLLAESDRLMVVSWGTPGGDGEATHPGRPLAIDWEDRSIRPLAEAGFGHLDGVERSPHGDGEARRDTYLISDWINGALYRWSEADDVAERLIDLPQGSADIGIIPGEDTVLIPLMNDGVVRAYGLDQH